MRKIFAILSIFFLVVFSGCAQKNVSENKTSEKTKDSKLNDKVDDNLYDEVISLRYKLFRNNGLDYVPWRSHINDDKTLMTYLKNNLKSKELSSYTKGYRLTSTTKKSFVADKDKYIFINKNSSISDIKKFLKTKVPKKHVSYKKHINVKKVEYKKSTTLVNQKKPPKQVIEDTLSRTINFRARGVPGEADLERLLYSISYEECFKIYEYIIFPMRNFKILIDDKYKRMEIDIRATKSQILSACRKN